MGVKKTLKDIKRRLKRSLPFFKTDEKVQFVVQGDPMLRIVKASDLRELFGEGYNIPYNERIRNIDDVKRAVNAASRISATGGVTVLTERFLTSCKPSNLRKNRPLLWQIQKQITASDDANPCLAVITNPPGKITARTKEEAEAEERQDEAFMPDEGFAPQPTQDGRLFLKAPLTDDMLTEALASTAAALLNDEHTARMKWKDDEGYHEKEYGVNHLLVCLFYYVYINELHASSSFFFRQRTQFHDYCIKNLPDGLGICTERYFRNCINKLQLKSCSFDEYIRCGIKPKVEWQKGQFNVEFWYAVYREASRHYAKTLIPTVQD